MQFFSSFMPIMLSLSSFMPVMPRFYIVFHFLLGDSGFNSPKKESEGEEVEEILAQAAIDRVDDLFRIINNTVIVHSQISCFK